MIRKLSNSKYKKQEIIQEYALNKYEIKVSEFEDQKGFFKALDGVRDIFDHLHPKGKQIIHDLVEIQHKILSFCKEAHLEFERMLSILSIDQVLSVSDDWSKFRTDEFISDKDLWELDINDKIIDIIQ